jgi:hypothetical protein
MAIVKSAFGEWRISGRDCGLRELETAVVGGTEVDVWVE